MHSRGTVHIVDDDAARRESLVALIEEAGYRVRAFASADELLAADCDVTDTQIPGMDRLALCHRLRADSIELPLVLITGHGDIAPAAATEKGGNLDCPETPFDAEALAAAAADLRCLHCDRADPHDSEAARQRLRGLTQRERDVLQHIVAGASNKRAAVKLGVSPRTIEFHRARIMSKTGARGLPDLVRWWLAAHSSRSEVFAETADIVPGPPPSPDLIRGQIADPKGAIPG